MQWRTVALFPRVRDIAILERSDLETGKERGIEGGRARTDRTTKLSFSGENGAVLMVYMPLRLPKRTSVKVRSPIITRVGAFKLVEASSSARAASGFSGNG